jgi:hypothetical protein
MKIKALALLLLLPSLACAAEDCAKTSDACYSGKKQVSPFLAASAPEAPAPAAQPLKQGRQRKAELKQAPVSTAPAVEVSTSVPAAPAKSQSSSPAWLLVVIGGLAALYFYLSGGRRRGRRK